MKSRMITMSHATTLLLDTKTHYLAHDRIAYVFWVKPKKTGEGEHYRVRMDTGIKLMHMLERVERKEYSQVDQYTHDGRLDRGID